MFIGTKSLFPKIIIFTSFHREASNSMFSKLTFKFQYCFMQHIFSTTTLFDTRSGAFESSWRDLSKTGLKIIMFQSWKILWIILCARRQAVNSALFCSQLVIVLAKEGREPFIKKYNKEWTQAGRRPQAFQGLQAVEALLHDHMLYPPLYWLLSFHS